MSSSNEHDVYYPPSRNFTRLINVIDMATPPVLAELFQYYIEINGKKPGPFNFMEEFTEGCLPALLGGIAMLGLYTYLTRNEHLDHETNTAEKCFAYGTGVLFGYVSMVLIGKIISQALGVPDIKWGPFK